MRERKCGRVHGQHVHSLPMPLRVLHRMVALLLRPRLLLLMLWMTMLLTWHGLSLYLLMRLLLVASRRV